MRSERDQKWQCNDHYRLYGMDPWNRGKKGENQMM